MVEGWKVPLEESLRTVESQHNEIFDLSDKFFAAIGRADGGAIAPGIARTLTHFLRLHLDVEENLMARAGYPDFQDHKALHASLKSRISAITERNERGLDVADAMRTLISQFIQHHDHADIKFEAFVRKRPAGLDAALAGEPQGKHRAIR